MRPVSKRFRISNSYGRPGNYAAGYHTGTDFACPTGTPVRAPRTGVITQAGWNGAYGISVTVRGWGKKNAFLLAHLSREVVYVGKWVRRGQIIGYSGSTGNSTGPHLHAEQRRSPFGYWNHRRPSAWRPQ